MGMFQFLKQLNLTPPPGGDGVRQTRGLHVLADLRDASGLVLTAATVPAVVALETNSYGVSVVANQTHAGKFTFVVPAGYDAVADELKIKALAVSSADNDTPTLTATCYRKRPGVALATVTPAAVSAAIPNSTAKAAWRSVDFSGKGFQPGDVLTINLVTAAHATDAVYIHAVEMQFKGHIIVADPANR